jgi:two-component system chemotaxis response regulator CheB
LEVGHIYVAPPDRHLLVGPGRLALDAGPKENSVRPAIDPLFRSAASVYGERAAAVVLSGALGDGASGAAIVAAAGGPVFVQDPVDAMVPSMPEATLRGVPGARALTPEAIAAALAEFARGLPEPEAHEPWSGGGDHVEPARQAHRVPEGPASGFTCPECHGPLWELYEHEQVLYRCRVGHVFEEHSLVAAKDREVESALWSAVEALEERADLMERVAARITTRGRNELSLRYRERGAAATRWAGVLRDLLVTRGPEEESVAG